jgi:hypothetical protein
MQQQLLFCVAFAPLYTNLNDFAILCWHKILIYSLTKNVQIKYLSEIYNQLM